MTEIDMIKKDVTEGLSIYSLETLHRFIDEYQIFNAERSLAHNGHDTFYSVEKAQELLNIYDNIGMQCRNLYYAFCEELEPLTDPTEIYDLRDYYMSLYDAIEE